MSDEIVLSKQFEIKDLIQRICKQRGKKIETLRIPIGHSELNSIERWILVKSDVERKSPTLKIIDVEMLAEEWPV